MKKFKLFLMMVFALFLTVTSVNAEELQCTAENSDSQAKYSITVGSSTKYCKTLTNAFKEVDDKGTVKMLKEDTISSMARADKKAFTFDLNGQTLNANVNGGAGVAFVGCDVTIKDSGSNGKITSSNGAAVLVATGKLTLKGGTIEVGNAYSALQIGQASSSATFVMDGGTVKNSHNNDSGFALNIAQGEATVNDGSITANTSNTVAVGGAGKDGGFVKGTLTVKGGTIENTHTSGESNKAIIIVDGETTVKGGTVTSSAPGETVQVGQPSGPDTVKFTIESGKVVNTNASGLGILVARGEAIVNGGAVTSDGTSATIQVGNSKEYAAKLTIKDGTVENKKNVPAVFVPYGKSEANIDGGIIKINENDDTSKNDVAIIVGHNKDSDQAGEGAKVTITKGTVTGGVALFGKQPTLDIQGGDITAKSFAVSGNGSPEGSKNATINSKITISGGNLTSTESAAIYHPQNGDLDISGDATITGKIGIVARQGNVNVTGGKIKATVSSEGDLRVGDAKENGEYVKLPSGTGIIVDNSEKDGYPNKSKVTVTNGVVDGEESSILSYGDDTTDFSVAGGTFLSAGEKDDVTIYLPKEGNLEQSESGKVGTVYKITVNKAKNGKVSTEYSNAVKGEEVTVKTTADKGYELDKLVVTYGNGKTVKVTKGKFLMPEGNVTITATFKVTAENPDTFDNIMTYVSLATVSTMAIVCAALYLKKKAYN